MSLEEPTLPTIHLNGTSARDLYEQYRTLRAAINAARDCLFNATCNPRDFYPQGSEVFTKAQSERWQVANHLADLADFAHAWEEHARSQLSELPPALESTNKRPPPEQELLLRIYLLLKKYNAEIDCYHDMRIVIGGAVSKTINSTHDLRKALINYGLLPSDDPAEAQP
jgi:hypothetical protein